MVSIILFGGNDTVLQKRTIDSILKQTYTEWELLIFVTEIMRNHMDFSMGEKDSRIRYVFYQSQKDFDFNELVLCNIKGKWVAYAEAGTEWKPAKLEAQLFAMKKAGTRACCTNAFSQVHNDKRVFHGASNIYYFRELLLQDYVLNCSGIIHRSVIDEIGPVFDENEQNDSLWLKVTCFTGIVYLSSPLLFLSEKTKQNSNIKKVKKEVKLWAKNQSITVRIYVELSVLLSGFGRKNGIWNKVEHRVRRR